MSTLAEDRFFGSPDQQQMLRRGRAMFELMRDDPAYSYYGRTVGAVRPDETPLERLCALAILQGATHYARVPNTGFSVLSERAVGLGLSTTQYLNWQGQRGALGRSQAILSERRLPSDLDLVVIDEKAHAQDLVSLSEVALSAGVLPIAGSALLGQTRPGIGFVALEPGGRAVACAAAAASFHPDAETVGGHCWWGMLATHPDRRGQGLAMLLGAHAMVEMHRRYGFDAFYTGVQPGNASSESVCSRMGLTATDESILTLVDPSALPGGSFTR